MIKKIESILYNHKTCPSLQDYIRPTIEYVKCHICNGDVEIWSDEKVGICTKCGAEWNKPDNTASCLEYCKYASKCLDIIEKKRN